ncbi:MAG TPA: hypothetical protein VGS19_28470 [Streptosporangiaceae bacterium]|nr:hypothetical protein [Streptosporangiaceae bacterium]
MQTSTDIATWWTSLTLVNAGLAQTKGRSGLNWWLVSLFLGPLATLLIVVWRPVTERAPGTQ